MYLSRAPLAAFLAGMASALQDELAPLAPERRAEIPVIRSNANMCRMGMVASSAAKLPREATLTFKLPKDLLSLAS
jgi:hypothetical protein